MQEKSLITLPRSVNDLLSLEKEIVSVVLYLFHASVRRYHRLLILTVVAPRPRGVSIALCPYTARRASAYKTPCAKLSKCSRLLRQDLTSLRAVS
jgi:hypothetical protein